MPMVQTAVTPTPQACAMETATKASACMPEQQEATAGMKNHVDDLSDSLGREITGESRGCILLDVRRSYGG